MTSKPITVRGSTVLAAIAHLEGWRVRPGITYGQVCQIDRRIAYLYERLRAGGEPGIEIDPLA